MLPNELLLAVICCSALSLWVFTIKNTAIVIAVFFSFLTFFLGFISTFSLLLIVLFAVCCFLYKNTKSTFYRFFLSIFMLVLIFLPFSQYITPSKSIYLFEGTKFSPISAPFFLRINIEKAVLGIILAAYLVKIASTFNEWKKIIKEFFSVYSVIVLLLLTPAVITNYIKFDFKIPSEIYLFILNNLLLTCLAEEVIFRGFLQKNIYNILQKMFKLKQAAPLIAIFSVSLLFGFFHYKMGILMMIFSFIASVGYGYAYQKSEKIESAILVHFGVNITHFIFFTYPYYKII